MSKAIIFDLDDTLYDLCWPFEMAVNKFFSLRGKGIHPAMDSMEDIFLASRKHSDAIFPDWTAGRVTSDDMYAYRNQNAFHDFGIEVSREEALEIQSYYKEFQKQIHLSGEVERMLQQLVERNVKVGIISNGGGEHQWNKVHTLGLTKWIPQGQILISGEVGAAKPDPRIFDFARWKLKIPREDAWYVGDTYENDIVGAHTAGWHSIWVNRRHNALPWEMTKSKKEDETLTPRPDFMVSSEADMAHTIMTLC